MFSIAGDAKGQRVRPGKKLPTNHIVRAADVRINRTKKVSGRKNILSSRPIRIPLASSRKTSKARGPGTVVYKC